MTTAWDWRFELKGCDLDITIDLCSWLVGIAVAGRNTVICPLPCISVSVIFYDEA